MRFQRPSHRRGSVLLELALCLPVLFLIMGVTVMYGRVLYNYHVALKATHDACRYLASISQRDMKNPSRIGNEVAVARYIISEETTVLPKDPYAPSITILCGGATCDGFSVPATVTVTVRMYLAQSLLPGFTAAYVPPEIVLTASSTMSYTGI